MALFTGVDPNEQLLGGDSEPKALTSGESKTIEAEVVDDDEPEPTSSEEDEEDDSEPRPWEKRREESPERPTPSTDQEGSGLLSKFQQEIDAAKEETE